MPTVTSVLLRSDGYTVGTAAAKAEEGMGNGRSVCPEYPGLHAGYNGWDNGYLPRKGMEISLNPILVRIEGCNSPS